MIVNSILSTMHVIQRNFVRRKGFDGGKDRFSAESYMYQNVPSDTCSNSPSEL